MYYLKSQYQIHDLHKGMIESFAKVNGFFTPADRESINSLIETYRVNWWMSFDDCNDNDAAKVKALKAMLHLPASMNDHAAAQVFRNAMNKRGGIQQMLSAVYEEVAPGTEEKWGHTPAPIDWAEESNNLFHLREEAIAYITEHTENAFYEYSGADIVYADVDSKRLITVGWDGEDSDKAQTEEVEDLDISVLADLCVVIQKAMAG